MIAHLSKKLDQPKKLSEQFLDELVSLTYKEAKKGFVIPGLGKFSVTQRSKRTGRNPQTGATIIIPAKKVVKFKVGKQVQDAVFGKK
ncbi:MAG: HU family DNA-binding protein [bacterium]